MNTHFSLKTFLQKENSSTLVQVIKYGFCGGLSAAVMFGIVFLLNFFFPDFVSRELNTEEVVSYHTNIFNTLGFIPSSIVAYLTNRAFVFTPGKHSIGKEFGIFSIVALAGFLGGIWGSDWVIRTFNTPSIVGTVAFGVTSAMVNFVCRKFIIFKG